MGMHWIRDHNTCLIIMSGNSRMVPGWVIDTQDSIIGKLLGTTNHRACGMDKLEDTKRKREEVTEEIHNGAGKIKAV